MSAKMNSAVSDYNNYGYNSEIDYADPHRLIQMLFEGALKRIAYAKGAMQRKQIAEKGKFISQAIEIVGGLQASLDLENGGEIAENLESLYDYISRQLVTANLKNSEEILNEVSSLLRDVKKGWDAINTPEVEQKSDMTDTPIKADRVIQSKATPEISKAPEKPVNTHASRALKAYSS